MLISLNTLRLLVELNESDTLASEALDDLGIDGMPRDERYMAGRMMRTRFIPWWALAEENKLRDESPTSHWDRAEMLN